MNKLKALKLKTIQKMYSETQELYLALDRRIQEHLTQLSKVLKVETYDYIEKTLALLYFHTKISATLHDISRNITLAAETIEELSPEATPPINWPQLPYTLPHKLVPHITTITTLNTPENIFTKTFLQTAYLQTKTLTQQYSTEAENRPWLKLVLNKLKQITAKTQNLLKTTWIKYVETPKKTKPEHTAEKYKNKTKTLALKGAIPIEYLKLVKLYEDFKKLSSNLKTSIGRALQTEKTIGYFINPNRLYEIYTLLNILNLLQKQSTQTTIEDHREATYFLYTLRNNTVVKIAFNQINDLANKHTLKQIKTLLQQTTVPDHKYLGLPDIIIKKNDRIILAECKFKYTPSSLTEARYKVLGYLLEYNTDTGILFFPQTLGKPRDPESLETHKLFKEAQEKGIAIEYNENLSKKIIIVAVNPLKPPEQNQETLRKALEEAGILP